MLRPKAPSFIASSVRPFISSISEGVGCLFSIPIARSRTLPCPTSERTFVDGRATSRASRYSPKPLQLQSISGSPLRPERYFLHSSTTSSLRGASPRPSWPTTSVVMPCIIFCFASGSEMRMRSEWLCVSMNPGATTSPSALIVASASPVSLPISTILSPMMPMSALYHGFPVPSTTFPLLITRSNISSNLGTMRPKTI